MKSYLKFLSRNRLYTAVEAAGLVISIAFVVLIGNYVRQQYAMAHQNPLGRSIYTVLTDENAGLSWWDKASFEEQLPELEAACRLSGNWDDAARIDGEMVHVFYRYADANIFDMMPQLQLLSGDLDEFALKGRCLVSESFANARFGGDATGRRLEVGVDNFVLGSECEATVCGVYRDLDDSILGRCDVLFNAAHHSYADRPPFSTIGPFATLLMVAEGTDRDALTDKVDKICKANYGNIVDGVKLVRMDEIYFLGGQYFTRVCNASVLHMLVVVVVLLLVSAVFNYVNLNTALSGRRAKEMAMRRLLGSQRAAIFGKYIAESVAFTLLCTALALLTAAALRPALDTMLFNVSVEDVQDDAWQYVPLRLDWSAAALAVYALSAAIVGVIVGLAPAMLAMRYQPIDVVRGTFRRRTKMIFSHIFIVIQHVISVVLITMSTVMEVQMHHMMTRPLHGRTDGLYLLAFTIPSYEKVSPLVDRLHAIPDVGRVGRGSGVPTWVGMSTGLSATDDFEHYVMTSIILCDETYFELLGLERQADFRTPLTGSVWMSESLANELAIADSMQYMSPAHIRLNGATPDHYGGIYRDIPTADASQRDISSQRFSAAIIDSREKLRYANGLLIEVTGDRRAAAEAIHSAYAACYVEANGIYSPPFREGYLDDVIAAQLRPQKMAMRLLEIFMLLSVVISLLGLVAMSTYHAGENRRSIAIRKVFGSDVRHELMRTVSGYMIMVAVAVAIAMPVAVWAAGRYLERFDYRISGYWWIFVVAAAVAVSIAFLSVFWQTWRAARTNPATELKSN